MRAQDICPSTTDTPVCRINRSLGLLQASPTPICSIAPTFSQSRSARQSGYGILWNATAQYQFQRQGDRTKVTLCADDELDSSSVTRIARLCRLSYPWHGSFLGIKRIVFD